ncbi:hypothetical protein KY339_04880 [Candidatus Woesearchaeota archaeon]|nr:hypothetical protein [Candidatus Woesearchaeota archaeon]
MGLKKQAAFFTIDALVGAMILITGILLLTSSYVSDQPRINLNYLSQDIINVLGTLTINELNSTNSYVNGLITDGNITHLNNTVLEQIGEFWAKNDMGLAENLTRNITEGFVPDAYGFGLWISNELIYKRNIPITSIVTSKRIISGMEKAKPIKGFVSKARATVVNRNMTKVISISPEGAGWFNGEARISKFFNFSGDYTLGKVTFYVSVHIGNNDDDFTADFNGIGGCSFDVTDMNMISEE